jgi:hypothetical protein
MSILPSNFTVPSTGNLKLSDIKKAFKNTNTIISLSNFYRNRTYVPNVTRLSAIPISGLIRFSNFRNTTNTTLRKFTRYKNGDSASKLSFVSDESELFIIIPSDFRAMHTLNQNFIAETNGSQVNGGTITFNVIVRYLDPDSIRINRTILYYLAYVTIVDIIDLNFNYTVLNQDFQFQQYIIKPNDKLLIQVSPNNLTFQIYLENMYMLDSYYNSILELNYYD